MHGSVRMKDALKKKAPFVTELENPAERVHQIQQILITLPRVVIVVMRYLFAFLNQ